MPSNQRVPLNPHEEQFMAAVLYGDIVTMRHLLKAHGKALLGVTTIMDDMAIHVAAKKGNLAAVKLFVEFGADLEAVGFSGKPLHAAANFGEEAIAQCLLDAGARIDSLSEDGTALMVALNARNHAIVRLLLDRGARVGKPYGSEENDLVNAEGDDAENLIRENNDPVAMREFVERGLIDLGGDYTLLDWILSDCDMDVSKLVLECLGDPTLGGEVSTERLRAYLDESESEEVREVLMAELSSREVAAALGAGPDCAGASRPLRSNLSL
jgi:hypothetical protein